VHTISLLITLDLLLGCSYTQERQYAADCTISWATVKPAVFDIFFFSHFMGWVLKSLMFR